jgi:hypothetical protein
MFLSIPFVAVLKIIFDHITELKPWGKLLGDKMPLSVPSLVVNKEEQNDNGPKEVPETEPEKTGE